jgi:hypothetical protein
VFAGGFLVRIKISSAREDKGDNIPAVLNTWVRANVASWRGLGDEMAKRPLKTHTIYL